MTAIYRRKIYPAQTMDLGYSQHGRRKGVRSTPAEWGIYYGDGYYLGRMDGQRVRWVGGYTSYGTWKEIRAKLEAYKSFDVILYARRRPPKGI